MSRPPSEVDLEHRPRSRYEVIDVSARLRRDRGDVLVGYPHVLYCSHHTTAGFLGRADASRFRHRLDRVDPYMDRYRSMFPQNAGYRHDAMELRRELTDEQRSREPANGDAHLVFIGAGLESCVTYPNHPRVPVFFMDLDGVCDGRPRTRHLTAVGYTVERVVAEQQLEVPVSRHAIDSVNLFDRRLGIADRILEMARSCPTRCGRLELRLDPSERDAGVTVNEYETLLMRHDLAEVLGDPLRFVAHQGRRVLRNPLAVPAKSRGYARYDLVQVVNRALDALRLDGSVVERALSRLMAVPARARLRLRRSISFAVDGTSSGCRLIRGRYQSPILIQWSEARSSSRVLHATLSGLA
jgi:hypothetical protein